jgi:hypothetical protein
MQGRGRSGPRPPAPLPRNRSALTGGAGNSVAGVVTGSGSTAIRNSTAKSKKVKKFLWVKHPFSLPLFDFSDLAVKFFFELQIAGGLTKRLYHMRKRCYNDECGGAKTVSAKYQNCGGNYGNHS